MVLWEDKIDKQFTRLVKKKRRKTHINRIRNEKGEVKTDTAKKIGRASCRERV